MQQLCAYEVWKARTQTVSPGYSEFYDLFTQEWKGHAYLNGEANSFHRCSALMAIFFNILVWVWPRQPSCKCPRDRLCAEVDVSIDTNTNHRVC